MAKADIAALLALGAAFFIAIGDVIHQRSAHEVTDEESATSSCSPGCCATAVVARQPGRGGRVRAAGGGARPRFRAAVQALLVTSLLFALPINARLAIGRVTRWEWLWRRCSPRRW